VEESLLGTLDELGIGTICFSPLAQGMLSDKYLNGVPEGSRVTKNSSLSKSMLSKDNLERIGKLNDIAKRRGQSLAQMALAWVLRRKEVTSVLIGASSSTQIRENVAALDTLGFTDGELKEIDKYAQEGNINLWAKSSNDG
jgi:L-glyceraldehyde 3-phosphate reductase